MLNEPLAVAISPEAVVAVVGAVVTVLIGFASHRSGRGRAQTAWEEARALRDELTASNADVREAEAARADAERAGNQERADVLSTVESGADRTADQIRASVEVERGLTLASAKPYVAVLGSVVFGGLAMYILVRHDSSDDDRKAAWSTVSGILGFWLGVESR